MRKLIYFIKRRLQKNHQLYFFLYEVLTFNRAKLEQFWNRRKYLSRFGGGWTDRKDFSKIFSHMTVGCSKEEIALLEKWHCDGYVVLRGAISSEEVDSYLSEIGQLKIKRDTPLLVTGQYFKGAKPIADVAINAEGSIRTIDDYMFLPAS